MTQGSIVTIGRLIQQPGGFKAFVPEKFPPKKLSFSDPKLVKLLSEADLALGRLDGLTKNIPDLNFFVLMYMKKESALSSQIEGTKARLTDALYAEAGSPARAPADVSCVFRPKSSTIPVQIVHCSAANRPPFRSNRPPLN